MEFRKMVTITLYMRQQKKKNKNKNVLWMLEKKKAYSLLVGDILT